MDTLVAAVPVISAVVATPVVAVVTQEVVVIAAEAVATDPGATAIDNHQSPQVMNPRAFFFLIYSISIR